MAEGDVQMVLGILAGFCASVTVNALAVNVPAWRRYVAVVALVCTVAFGSMAWGGS